MIKNKSDDEDLIDAIAWSLVKFEDRGAMDAVLSRMTAARIASDEIDPTSAGAESLLHCEDEKVAERIEAAAKFLLVKLDSVGGGRPRPDAVVRVGSDVTVRFYWRTSKSTECPPPR